MIENVLKQGMHTEHKNTVFYAEYVDAFGYACSVEIVETKTAGTTWTVYIETERIYYDHDFESREKAYRFAMQHIEMGVM